MTSQHPSLASEIDAALGWWQAAGVDCDFADDARAWLADPVEHAADTAPQKRVSPTLAAPVADDGNIAPSSAAPAAIAIARHNFWGDSPPQSLAEFHQWWAECDDLGRGGLYPRIAPSGIERARLMVVVSDPEAEDTDRLLSGPQGRLLANILSAMGIAPDEYYLASALPCHTPLADLAILAASGFDTVLARHIALAAPQRVLVLGSALAPMLNDVNLHSLRHSNYVTGTTPLMVNETLEAMLHMPRLKARFWRRWMEWSANSAGAS